MVKGRQLALKQMLKLRNETRVTVVYRLINNGILFSVYKDKLTDHVRIKIELIIETSLKMNPIIQISPNTK